MFAEERLAGNPLAVFENARGLSDADMQALALQFNLSETTFILPSEVADARVRIFTPTFEMPFAGHPTLGSAHVVRALAGAGNPLALEMLAGTIPVIGQGDVWTLEAKPPAMRKVDASREQLAAMLGLAESVRCSCPWGCPSPLRAGPGFADARWQRTTRRGRYARDGLRMGGGRTADDTGAVFLSQARRDRRGPGDGLGVREPRWLASRNGCLASPAMDRRPRRSGRPALQARARRGLRGANFCFRTRHRAGPRHCHLIAGRSG